MASPQANAKKVSQLVGNHHRRSMSLSPKQMKCRMTIEEVRAALEPITRAREQALMLQRTTSMPY
jgi:hypothetical protein